ncbi:enhanced serine sensitivity protein SseB C-terminal domain-containing protein [Myroides sp. LJL115]
MSFYNRNKNTNTAVKLNKNLAISKLIELSADQPEYRAVFYKRLLNDKIFILVDSNYSPDAQFNQGIDPNIPILTFDNQVIPIFTEQARIYDSGAITKEVEYLQVDARAFLELSIGSPIIVNPFSTFYKELVPNEIAQMLNGSIFTPNSAPIINVKMNAIIGKPSSEPKELLEDLSDIFMSNPLVEAAHLGWTTSEEQLIEPHYIIAIESNENSGEFKQIAKEVSDIAQKHLKGDQVIDIIKLQFGGNFSDYFYKHSTAFYQKQ